MLVERPSRYYWDARAQAEYDFCRDSSEPRKPLSGRRDVLKSHGQPVPIGSILRRPWRLGGYAYENPDQHSTRLHTGRRDVCGDRQRSTEVCEDLVAQGGIGLRTLALRNASPLEGGIPLIVDGKIIGAIGVSGALSSQDGQVAKSGAEAAK